MYFCCLVNPHVHITLTIRLAQWWNKVHAKYFTMHATLGHNIPDALIHVIAVNMECEMVLHVGQVPMLVYIYIRILIYVGGSKQKSVLYSPYKHKCSILGSYKTL